MLTLKNYISFAIFIIITIPLSVHAKSKAYISSAGVDRAITQTMKHVKKKCPSAIAYEHNLIDKH